MIYLAVCIDVFMIIIILFGADGDIFWGSTGTSVGTKTHMKTMADISNPYFYSLSEHM